MPEVLGPKNEDGSYLTTVELLAAATARLELFRTTYPGAPAREFSIAITAIEDAQMRSTRGLAMVQGKFHPADLEQ